MQSFIKIIRQMADYFLSVHPWCHAIEYESYKEKEYDTCKYFLYPLLRRIGSSFVSSGNRVLDTGNH